MANKIEHLDTLASEIEKQAGIASLSQSVEKVLRA